MLAKAHSFGLSGLEAYLVTIEVDVANGLPAMTIVGLPDSAIKESKDRVRAAIRNSGLTFPCGRITINLAPADTRKEGPSFDLAIALAILAASEQAPLESLTQFIILGELSLDGRIKPITGGLSAALKARTSDMTGLIVPLNNAEECALTGAKPVFPCQTLNEALVILQDPKNAPFFQINTRSSEPLPSNIDGDLADIKGQSLAKRGLEIASAGGHNALLIGPPGSGKTMLARRFTTILPPLSQEEALEVTRIASVTGTLPRKGLIYERPFRSPHHTSSNIALVGGGTDPRPGEATLAHHGVLFLDEFPEFSRSTIESLRQPMEDGFVTIARAARTLRFPARFALLAAMNPCPCGHLGDRQKPCRCPSTAIQKYMAKISGPMLDRIDLHLDMPALKTSDLLSAPTGESSESIRQRVITARAIQAQRFRQTNIFANAQMSHRQLREFCPLNQTCQNLMKDAVESLGLSARAHDKVLKVARTISDLAESQEIAPEHLAEAIGYRSLDKINL